MFQDKFIFTITPAPSEQNKSKIEWRGFLDDLNEDIVIFDDETNTILFRIGSGGGVLPVNYAELLTLIGSNGLITGRQYLITDFATRYTIPNTAQVVTAATEPIIVTAASTSTIHANAISTVFPKDELLYEVVDSTTSGGNKGRIYFRNDTNIAVSAWYNWRVIQFRRWDDGSGNFTVLTDNSNAFQDFYTFNNSASAANCVTTSLGQITDFGISTFSAPATKLNNFVLSGVCINNVIENDAFDNTILCNTIGANRLGVAFFQNTILGGEVVSNTINVACVGNVIGSDFRDNNLGANFFANTIGDSFLQNNINAVFFGNSTGNGFEKNYISASMAINIIGDDFDGNTVGAEMQGNSIGNNFSVNTLGSKFQNNIIANNFTNNRIGNAFDSNININDNFTQNTVADGFSGVDFGAATLVYNSYTKNIFKNSAGSFRLSYVDGADTVQYAAPNA